MKALFDQSHGGQQRLMSLGESDDDYSLQKIAVWNVQGINDKEQALRSNTNERTLIIM